LGKLKTIYTDVGAMPGDIIVIDTAIYRPILANLAHLILSKFVVQKCKSFPLHL